MTARDTAAGEPHAAHETMRRESPLGVTRARRVKAALAAQERREGVAVRNDQRDARQGKGASERMRYADEESGALAGAEREASIVRAARSRSVPSSSRSLANVAVAAAGAAMTT